MKLDLRMLAIFAAAVMLGSVMIGCSGEAAAPPAAPAGASKDASKEGGEEGNGKGAASKGMSPNDLKPTDAAKGAESRIGSAAGGR